MVPGGSCKPCNSGNNCGSLNRGNFTFTKFQRVRDLILDFYEAELHIKKQNSPILTFSVRSSVKIIGSTSNIFLSDCMINIYLMILHILKVPLYKSKYQRFPFVVAYEASMSYESVLSKYQCVRLKSSYYFTLGKLPIRRMV